MHFVNNAMAVILSFMNQRGVIDADLESFGSTDSAVVIVLSFLLVVMNMWLIFSHHKGYFKKKTPAGEQPGS